MKPTLRIFVCAALGGLLLLTACEKRDLDPAAQPEASPTPAPAESAQKKPVQIRTLQKIKSPIRALGQSATYDAPQISPATIEVSYPPEVAAFDAWLSRYLAATPERRSDLRAEGIALSTARAEVLQNLIATDPESAIYAAVPEDSREFLPPEILEHLETIVADKGLYAVTSICNHGPEAAHGEGCRIEHQAIIGPDFRTIYKASIYGSRGRRLTEENASLFGVALGDRIALHEDDFVVRDAAAVTNDPARAGQLAVTYMGQTTFVPTEADLPALIRSLQSP